MTNEITNIVQVLMPHIEGYVYPNEATRQPLWGILIVLYPYITGLVAGAFIMASLVRVFNVKALEPVYRLSMLTAFAFLLCAPLPLLCHLGHPERCYEVMMTPHLTSPMAIFGFVYAWYLMAVLLLELWFDYRRDFVVWSESTPGFKGILYRLFTVGVTDVSDAAVQLDHKTGPHPLDYRHSLGLSAARLRGLHLRVHQGQSVVGQRPNAGHLYPVGDGLGHRAVRVQLHGAELDSAQDRRYEMPGYDGSVPLLRAGAGYGHRGPGLDSPHLRGGGGLPGHAIHGARKLFYTLNLGQVTFGTLVPLILLGLLQLLRRRVPELQRRRMFFTSASLILTGVLAMRWNVVIGGQLFSKSLRGVMGYKMDFAGMEGWFMGLILILLPFVILTVFVKLFLSERLPSSQPAPHTGSAA